MPISTSPIELILYIADQIGSPQPLNSFARTNSTFYQTLNPLLYRRNIRKALTWAIRTSFEPTLQKCLDYGADLSSPASTTDGITPLNRAMLWRNDEAAMLLLRRGANPASISRHTIRAFVGEMPRTFMKLLDIGMYKDEHGDGYNPALHLAATHGAEELAKTLLQRPDIDVNHVLVYRPDEGSPLCVAAFRGHFRLVQMLLDHGATVDFRDGDGLTPLMLNVGALRSYRSEAIIKALVEAGADVHARDGRGRTPLMYAAKTTRRTYEYLLGQGADPETVDGKGKSAQMRVRSFVVDEDGSPYGREKEPFDDYDMR